MILTRGKSLEAPLAELRKTNTEAFVHTDLHEVNQSLEKEQIRQMTKVALLTNIKESSAIRSYGH